MAGLAAVQRVPVKLSLEDADGKPPLRAGMSAEITIDTGASLFARAGQPDRKRNRKVAEDKGKYVARSPAEVAKDIEKLEAEMMEHAKNLEFEQAAAVRDKIHQLREEGFMR